MFPFIRGLDALPSFFNISTPKEEGPMYYIKHHINASTSKEIHYHSKIHFESALGMVVDELIHRETPFQMSYHPRKGTSIQTTEKGNWEAYLFQKEAEPQS